MMSMRCRISGPKNIKILYIEELSQSEGGAGVVLRRRNSIGLV